jgi:putative NADPH-quinone reductase
LINGHPDPSSTRLAAALADAYARGAQRGGHELRRLDVGSIAFPLVITGQELEEAPPDSIGEAQEAILWADHLVLVFPLWLASPPALLKGFFEQMWRYGYAFDKETIKGLLTGRSVRMVVTMIIPSLVFHLIFASGVKAMRTGIFKAAGFKPVRTLIFSSVMTARHERWLAKMEDLGVRGQ